MDVTSDKGCLGRSIDVRPSIVSKFGPPVVL